MAAIAPVDAGRLIGFSTAVTSPEVVVDGGAVAVIDGHDGIGQVLAAQAMEDAIRRARLHGIGVVGLRNSNHFGTAMYFTRMAAAENCIGIIATNASPSMAPWGGRVKTLGNNPWSIAAPAGDRAPVVLDIANTAVARGKLYLAKQKGEAIPEGWAINEAGEATTDAAEGIAGIILPMADHKGYGISFMMDVLSGVLTGSKFLGGVHGPYQAEEKSGCGHFCMALDISRFRPLADFEADMETYIAEIKAVPRAIGFDEVFYPGEIEARNDIRHRRDGIALPHDTLADLKTLAQETGLEAQLPF